MGILGEDSVDIGQRAAIGLTARIAPKTRSALASYDSALHRALDWCAGSRLRASVALILLCFALFTPGVFSRPPIDRTEVRYALSTRMMLESGQWMVPHDESGAKVGRPIGILWLQGLATTYLGLGTLDRIWTYRLPSLIGATLAILLLFFGTRGIIGNQAAFCASVLMAHSLLLAVQSRLALPQASVLAAAILAQTSLLRLYHGHGCLDPASRKRTALAFWCALGVGVVLNSLIVPILALLTVAGLFVQDRSLKRLGGANHMLGLFLGLAIASVWFISLWLSIADPTPDPILSLIEWFSLLADSQAMNHRAFPGSFLLVTWIGILPGLVLASAACSTIWQGRHVPAGRFLLAWLVPYLVTFEIVSHKPPLYMVQYVLPVVAIGMALAVTQNPLTGAPRAMPFPWLLRALWIALGLGLAATPLALHIIGGEPVSFVLVIGAVAVAAFFAATAISWSHCSALASTSFSLAGAAVFYWLFTALILPTSSGIWPSTRLAELREALRTCYPEAPLIAGYREPSAEFLIGIETELDSGSNARAHFETKPRSLAFIDRSAIKQFQTSLHALNPAVAPVPVACVSGRNPFTSPRTLHFTVYAMPPLPTDPACSPPPRFRCPEPSAGKN